MPLDLTISKSRGKSNQSEANNHGGLRVRTDLIGPTIVNEGTVLDLSMSNRRRPGGHQPGNESEECDYSSRELTVPSSSARYSTQKCIKVPKSGYQAKTLPIKKFTDNKVEGRG